jgi:hypothetical protein
MILVGLILGAGRSTSIVNFRSKQKLGTTTTTTTTIYIYIYIYIRVLIIRLDIYVAIYVVEFYYLLTIIHF